MESPARIILESQNIGAPARNAHRPEPMASCRKTSVSAMDMSAVVWIRRRATRHSGAGIRQEIAPDSMTRKLSRSISIPLKFQRMFMPPPATRVAFSYAAGSIILFHCCSTIAAFSVSSPAPLQRLSRERTPFPRGLPHQSKALERKGRFEGKGTFPPERFPSSKFNTTHNA